MIQPTFRRSIEASSLWKPELRFTSPVVNRQRYQVHHTDGELSIERTWNDFFDWYGLEQAKRLCIAKGTIVWQEASAHLDLKIGLDMLGLFIFRLCQISMFTIPILFLFADWQVALVFSLAMVLNYFLVRAYARFVVRCFLEDLEYDIERFRVDASTRWHRVH